MIELNCIVVDDEPLALALLADYIEKTPGLNLLKATSDTFEALDLAKTDAADLVFLDMQMPELNGMQFLKILQQKCPVIVTTAYSEYALEGYEHHVVDYLLKPITMDRFLIAVDKARERFAPQTVNPVQLSAESQYIFIKTDYRLVRIDLDDIHYLEGARDYVVIHTGQDTILTLQSMKSLEEQLPANRFARIHKSYLVAIDKIDFIERAGVSLKGRMIPVSDTYKDRLNSLVRQK